MLVLSALFLNAQYRKTFSADNDSASGEQIKRLEYLLADLLSKGNIEAYSGYLTEDYTRISAGGEVSTKEQVLDGFKKSAGNIKMSPRDLKVSVYGNTAILHAVLDLETGSGDSLERRTSLITKVFIKRNGNWYMASLQGTAAN
jgi:ketosteroid isomerase-like protein